MKESGSITLQGKPRGRSKFSALIFCGAPNFHGAVAKSAVR